MGLNFIQYFDLFSQKFEFNLGKRRHMKGTFIGACVSVSIITFVLFYFITLLQLYLNNQIDPKFRTQSFVSNSIQIQLKNDLISFSFFQGDLNLETLQKQNNKTYIVPFAQFVNQGIEQNLEIIDCDNPQLIGYKCIDFSKISSNQTLQLMSDNNTVYYKSMIRISAYRCQDIDSRKTFIPNNCASPTEIDQFINNLNNVQRVKLSIKQFNITSNQFEQQYKSQNILMSTQQVIFTEFKTQQQITKVKQGFLMQYENTFESPMSYIMNTISYQTEYIQQSMNMKYFTQFFLDVDETVFYTQIQYPTFADVVVLCNSALALLMCLGFICKRLAFGTIRQELFLLTLKNYFQGTYKKILKQNNIFKFDRLNINEINQKVAEHDIEEDDILDSVFIPTFEIKSGENILKHNNFYTIKEDQVKDSETQKLENNIIMDKLQENPQHEFKNNNQKKIINKKKNEQAQQINEKIKVDESKSLKKKLRLLRVNSDQQNSSIQQPQHINQLKSQNNGSFKTQYNEKYVINDQSYRKTLKNLSQISQLLSSLSNKSLNKKIENILFKFKIRRRVEYQSQLGLNPQKKKIIEEMIDKNIDFLMLYEDILFLQKAVMMILSKEQFATLKLVSCSESFQLSKSTNYNAQNNCQENYFEEQLAISLSQQKQVEYIKQFFQNCHKNSNLSVIDQRILSSVL
ncbi:transmembrane protein, putative (macronuclear) [Tetrahymena thermophila SB210]|uniref:Transmembrane protein, putative n=1 Tax=Tetrahymena thermophila (strain SB210) TaxID=312017 RepID=W7XBY8_TETTS|nr:transmembrane protein, putative [Tetrahymena thermophila SB210]EWS74842.1 transmembrane protein, putative [Tetrahymena thermophila SB210]|eukprot:XP_012652555.1 transmembrane protein, putative [Tetrahymena thermophila SB210]